MPIDKVHLRNIGLLLLAAVLFFSPYLTMRPQPLVFPNSDLGSDLPREIWPTIRFMVDEFRETGEIPLWRPYLLSGAPIAGHPVFPFLYPLYWLSLLVPLPLALLLIAVFDLWLLGVGVYLFLAMEQRLPQVAALTGALVFSHTPKWIAHLSGGHWPMFTAIAWWPWAWFALSYSWRTGKKSGILLLGVALAGLLMNHGPIFAMAAIPLGVWTLGWLRKPLAPQIRRAAAIWLPALLVALGLSAGQILPFIELLPFSTRSALTWAEASYGSLPPALLLGALFAPALRFPEWFLYPGAGALLLALVGWSTGWSRTERLWALAGLAGVVLSLGGYTPVYGALYRFIPGLSLLRLPARWWILVLFAMTVLAAHGMAKWTLGHSIRHRYRRLSIVVLAGLYILLSAATLAFPDRIPFDVLSSAIVFLVVAVITTRSPSRPLVFLAISVVLLGQWIASSRLVRPGSEEALLKEDRVIQYMRESSREGTRSFSADGALPIASLVVHDLRSADGYDSFQLEAYAELGKRASGCDFDGYSVTVPPMPGSAEASRACPVFSPHRGILSLLNVRHIILPAPSDTLGAPLVASDGGRWVYDLGTGFGRAFGVMRGTVATPETCFDELASLTLPEEAIVEVSLPFGPQSQPPRLLTWRETPNGETFRVAAATSGLLVRSEAWAPGWTATIDGEPVGVLRVDCALQGVWVDPGEHSVSFEYAPRGFLVGRWISLGTVVVLMFGGFAGLLRRR